MTKTTATTTPTPPKMPKSYLLDEKERAAFLREGSPEGIYTIEARRAFQAGDLEASWAWHKMTPPPAEVLLFLKYSEGAQFIRDEGFDTSKADALYGPDWLERDI